MSDIKTLIEIRSQQFIDITDQILDKIQIALTTIQTFLEATKKDEYVGGFLVWEDVSLIDNDTILVIGIWQYEVGTIISVNDVNIEVTESNLPYFQRVIRVGFPFNIAESTDESEILNFLYQEQENQEQNDEEAKSDTDIVSIKVNPASDKSFNLSDLTPEQQESFKMFGFKGGNS